LIQVAESGESFGGIQYSKAGGGEIPAGKAQTADKLCRKY